MKPILEFHNVGKRYSVHGQKLPYQNFRDALLNSVSLKKNKKEDYWALKDINLEIEQGQSIGIIGRNGAGKSTLLKILSRITPPTTGKIISRGRIASLLEVGTGFHPELSGRENVFLNGAIMGMEKKTIKARFDEIVEFSGVEKFIDTPLKRYSSGMQLRLAFAVAAFLDPEILIIDEVLAVGDSEFQKKCLGKMDDVTQSGRTVLFVSHNIETISRLCKKTLLLDNGKALMFDKTNVVLSHYLQKGLRFNSEKVFSENSPGDDTVTLRSIRIHKEDFSTEGDFKVTEQIGITIDYEVKSDGPVFTMGCNIFNEEGAEIFSSHDVVSSIRSLPRTKGLYSSTMWIPGNLLREGSYSVGVGALRYNPLLVHFHERDTISFTVEDKILGDSARGEYVGNWSGYIRPLLQWDTKPKQESNEHH